MATVSWDYPTKQTLYRRAETSVTAEELAVWIGTRISECKWLYVKKDDSNDVYVFWTGVAKPEYDVGSVVRALVAERSDILIDSLKPGYSIHAVFDTTRYIIKSGAMYVLESYGLTEASIDEVVPAEAECVIC
jgi:hypothetical protein